MKYVPALLADLITQGYDIKLINEQTYCWDYPLVYGDGTKRVQFVFIGEMVDKEKDYLYIRSHMADFSDTLNAMQLLREAEYCSQSCVCLKPYTKADGTKLEAIYVQSVFPAALAIYSKDAFLDVVHEVATRADAIEKKYLGTDK
jgi:hypothetical protein